MSNGKSIKTVDGRIVGKTSGKANYRTVRKGDRIMRVRVIDADGPDFTREFTSAFRNSVKHARAENRELAHDS